VEMVLTRVKNFLETLAEQDLKQADNSYGYYEGRKILLDQIREYVDWIGTVYTREEGKK